MKIKIVQASNFTNPTEWYDSCIGQVFEATLFGNGTYRVVGCEADKAHWKHNSPRGQNGNLY